MNSINKQSSTYDLSRYNSVSPITNSVSNLTLTSNQLMLPQQTSTPLMKTSPWQKNSISPINHNRSSGFHSSIGRSPRYSLSSVNSTPKSLQSESSLRSTIQTVTGPLLASTRFNVNLGTYTETKSPGLTSRLVQYNNELSEKQTSTHQSKYGSPGLFPIVQLYKKEIPILLKNSRKCTVRIAPPDPAPYILDQANTILRDSFVQNNTDNMQCDTEINTKSVLEALKEISRKRIHSNDDDMSDDVSKRQRKGSVSLSSNGAELLNKDGKRLREVTPPKPKDNTNASSVNSATKKICVVNEIEGSLSSSRHMRMQQGQKRKAAVNSHLKINKQRRISNSELVSKQTQTSLTNGMEVVSEPKQKSTPKVNKEQNIRNKKTTAAQTEKQSTDMQQVFQNARRRRKTYEEKCIRDIDEENSRLPFCPPLEKPIQPLFSEKPLEIMRHNKLELIMAALSGQEPKLIPLPQMTLTEMKNAVANKDSTDGNTREVVSILSPKNKAKHDKHVTFSIPEDSNSQTNDKTTSEPNLNATAEATTLKDNNLKSSDASVTPANINFNFGTNAVSTSQVNFSSPVTFATLTSPKPSVLTFSPIASSPSSSTPVATFSLGSVAAAVSSEPPRINPPTFGAITTTTAANSTITSPLENVQKVEKPATLQFGITQSGLNFNPHSSNGLSILSSTPSSVTTNVTPEKNLLVVPSTATLNFGFSQITSTAEAVKSNKSTSGTQAFLFPSSDKQALSSSSTTKTTTTTASGMFSFKANTFPSSSASNQNSPKTGGFKFDFGKSSTTTPTTKTDAPSSSLFADSNLNKPGAFSFGTNTTTTSVPAFGPPNVTKNATAISTIASTVTTNTANIFRSSTPVTNSIVFGTPVTTNGTMFGTPSTTATGMFGTSNNVTTAATPVFGIPTTSAVVVPSFGTPNTTVNGIFGTPSTTANNTLFVGTNTTVTVAPNVFGAPTTTTATGIFGAPTTTSTGMFGSTTTNPAFGLAKPAESTASFSAFGTPVTTQNNSTFGSFTTPTTTQSSSKFGTFGTVQTAQNNAFGPPATTGAFTFGTNTPSKPYPFGAPTNATTTSSAMFGSNTPAANTTNVFGGNPSSGFGNATNATTTTASSFCQQAPNVFGPAQSGFGTNTAGTVFGGSNNNNAFGSAAPSNTFGTANPSNFGSNTTTNQGGVFGMGSTNQPSTITQGGTFGSSSSAAFGAFGTANTQQPAAGFNTFGTPGNTATGQPSAVFAFGAPNQGSSSAAPANAFQFGANTQAAKPTGFNFSANTTTPNINFGAGANTSFAAAPTPVFGTGTPGQFNAVAPATGMFNIGSGSTNPKQRPIMRARRRN